MMDLLQESDIGTAVDSAEVDIAEMARYLIESAPGGSQRDYIDALRKKTSTERELILRRERALKSLCELAVLKCLRPDLLVSALNDFAKGIVDVNYFDFYEDIEKPLIMKKKLMTDMTARDAAERILGKDVMAGKGSETQSKVGS
jgi:hypothetical protein